MNAFGPRRRFGVTVALFLLAVTGCSPSEVEPQTEPKAASLASWNDTATKQAIVDFVERVTDADGPDFVPQAERIAVFDNDGTLWAEQPAYFQLLFAIDRVRASADEHPEWRDEQPFKGVLDNDLEAVAASGEHGLLQLVMATHAGMTTEAYARIVADWIATARHPQLDRPFDELLYQPMLELLDYLRANGFKTFIVSGGGIEFMRVFVEEAYGIPPEQVVGSSLKTEYRVRDGRPEIVRLPELDFIDDKAGKPVGIHRHIGRRPIAAFGNSDGDFQMLEWSTAGDGLRLGAIVHHTDAEREWAYDRDSHIGRLERGLDLADELGWILIDMKEDWKSVFPSPEGSAPGDGSFR